MIKSFLRLALVGLLLSPIFSFATVHRVDDLGDPTPFSGTLTLRQAVSMAAPGDTIFIDVSGIIYFQADLTISNSITIIGGTASHLTLDINSYRWIFNSAAASTASVFNLKVTNSACPCLNSPVIVDNAMTARFFNVVFEPGGGAPTTSNNGGAILVQGAAGAKVECYNCSFINFSTGGNGGAVYHASSGASRFINCTFTGCAASGRGGALYINSGSAEIFNNTFTNNTSSPSLGHAIATTAGVSPLLINNIITDPVGGKANNLLNNSGGGTWASAGGNVFSSSAGALSSIISITGSDRVGEPFGNIQLRATVVTDGYGLKYFPIVAQTSVAVDNGVTYAAIRPDDQRRAPRVLYGDTGPFPDAGAVEFTPYRVTSTAGAGSFTNVWTNMNLLGGNGAPEYLEFDLPGSTVINLGSTQSYTGNGDPRIIDGFTQNGSKVAGPRNPLAPGTFIIPAVHFVTLQSAGTIFDIDLWVSGSQIAGLKFEHNGGIGINIVDDCNIRIFGNHFFSPAGTAQHGIMASGSSGTIAQIGGPNYFETNVISNYNVAGTSAGIVLANSTTGVLRGNFIGTTVDGLNSSPNYNGIIVGSGAMAYIGGYSNRLDRNVISNNVENQIHVQSLGNAVITGNIIGPNISRNVISTTGAYGVKFDMNSDGFVGTTVPKTGNIIGGQGYGISTNASNGITILGNFIGISPDAAATFPDIPNVTGISIISNGDAPVQVGNGTFAGRNYICSSSDMGIYIQDGNDHVVSGNFIGVRPDNTPRGNNQFGIHVVNSVGGNQLVQNVIADHSIDGISFVGGGGGDNIQNNKIGTDTLGIAGFGNNRGLSMLNAGISNSILSNLISGNFTEGVFIDNTTFSMTGNIIGLDLPATNAISNFANGVRIINVGSSVINNNTISSNGGNGIVFDNCSGIGLRGNMIGTNFAGGSFGNNNNGVFITGTSNNFNIGGNPITDQNRIFYNLDAGISIEPQVTNVAILKNRFFNNATHGITLNAAAGGSSVPHPNDVNDADVSGPAVGTNFGNNGQNFPNLLVASSCSAGVTLSGTMNVDNPTANYLFHVYRVSPANVELSGHGEGDSVVVEQSFNAGGLNTFPFSINLPTAVIGDIYAVTCSKDNGGPFETSEFSDTIVVRGGFSVDTLNITNVSCNGANNGSAEVTHTAVVAPITFQWFNASTNTPLGIATNVATGLPPGIYTCQVSDGGGCVITSDTVTITQPLALTATATPANVICFGACNGSITVNQSGGTPPYQYSIDNGSSLFASNFFSSLCAGGYQFVVVDGNGCISAPVAPANTVNITQPSAISLSPSVTNETCQGANNGTIALTAVGGAGGFTYSNNGGSTFGASGLFTGLPPNTYNCVVMDANGCTVTQNITVGAGTNVNANFSVSSTNACQNTFDFDFTDISTSGPSAITAWQWTFTGASPSAATIPNVDSVMFFSPGANNVELLVTTSDGCQDSITIPVNVNANPFVDAGLDTSFCLGSPYTHLASVGGGTPGYNYDWQPIGHFVDNTIEDAQASVGIINTIGYFEHVLTVVDANGCIGRDTMYMEVRSIPTVNAGVDFNACQGTAATLSGSGTAVSYTWDNGVSDGIPFIAGATTTYTVTGFDGTGCSNTDFMVLTVDIPYSVNAGLNTSVCESVATLVLNGSSSSPSVLWSTPNGSGSISTPTTMTTTYSVSSSDSVLTALDFILTTPALGACPSQDDTVSITLVNQPYAEAGNVPPTNCNSTNVPLLGTGANSPSYTWSTAGTGSFTSASSFSSFYTPGSGETGNVAVYLTAAANGTCPSHTDSVLINLVAGPSAFIGPDTTICRTGVPFITLNGAIADASGFNWITLGSGSWVASTSLTPDYYFSGADASSPSIQLVLEASSGACPSAYDTMLIVFTDPHSVFAGVDQTICSGSTVNLNGAITGSPGATWFGGGAFSPSSTTLTGVTYTPTAADISAGSAMITLTTDPFGACPVAKDTMIVTINVSPIANAGADASICLGGTYTLDASGSSGTISTYTWNELPAIFVASTITANVGPSATTSYEITVDNGTCFDKDTMVLTVNSPVDPTFNYSATSFCPSSGLQNPTVVTTGGIFSSSPAGLSMNTTTGIIDCGASTGGTYTIIYSFTVPCTAADTITITINTPVPATIAPDHTACLGDTVTFTATPLGGTWSGPGLIGTTSDMATIAAGVGVHTIQYSYFDATSGCTVIDTNNILVYPLPAVNFTGLLGPYCPSDGAVLLTGTPAGGVFFLNGVMQTMTTFNYDPTTPGLDTIAYVYIDPVTSCINFDGQGALVQTAPPPPIVSPPAPLMFCGSTPVTLAVSNPSAVVNWYSDSGLTVLEATGTTASSTAFPAGSGTIYVVNSTGGTCASSPTALPYSSYDASLVDMGGPYLTCVGQPVQLNVTAPGFPTFYWQNTQTLSDSTIANPIASPGVTQTYYIYVFDSGTMCGVYDSVTVTVNTCSLDDVTNAFSPNGDNVNDFWIINGIQSHPLNKVMIFNRWGDKMLDFTNYDNVNNVWDGKYKGSTVASGTYYFIIEYHDTNEQKAGWIQVNY